MSGRIESHLCEFPCCSARQAVWHPVWRGYLCGQHVDEFERDLAQMHKERVRFGVYDTDGATD